MGIPLFIDDLPTILAPVMVKLFIPLFVLCICTRPRRAPRQSCHCTICIRPSRAPRYRDASAQSAPGPAERRVIEMPVHNLHPAQQNAALQRCLCTICTRPSRAPRYRDASAQSAPGPAERRVRDASAQSAPGPAERRVRTASAQYLVGQQ